MRSTYLVSIERHYDRWHTKVEALGQTVRTSMPDHQIGNLKHRQLIDPVLTNELVAWELDLVTVFTFAYDEFAVGHFVEHIENSLHVLLCKVAEHCTKREINNLVRQFGELLRQFIRFRYAVIAQRGVNLPEVVFALQFGTGIIVCWRNSILVVRWLIRVVICLWHRLYSN